MVGFFNSLAHQLRTSIGMHRIGDVLRISVLPAEILRVLESAGCLESNQCYKNCCLAVSDHVTCARYVLCWLSCDESTPQGHAIIKIGSRYYDPTLESQPRFHGATYVFRKAFSRKELHSFLREAHANSLKNDHGEIEITPPVLHMDGTIRCEKDQNAPYKPPVKIHNRSK